MATTIPAAFQQLRSNLEITDLQSTTVSVRQQKVRSVLDAGLTVFEDFLTGSYKRSTMIAPLKEADVDVFVVLDVRYYQQTSGPAGLLDMVKRVLLKTYTRTPDISRNGQAVTIRFDDFSIDVVPGFNRQGGGYLIPNAITGTWLATNPTTHVTMMTQANAAQNGNLVPLVKMIKGWNKSHGSFFRSFHLEVIAMQVLQGVTITDFPSGLRFFFEKAHAIINQQQFDPAGYGDDVGSYINTPIKVADAQKRLLRAYELASLAEQYSRANRTRDAIDRWQALIPNYFPAYG